MNENFPPLPIPQPRSAARKKPKSRPIPLTNEVLARRTEIAKHLTGMIQPLSASLKAMSEKERKAVFYKLEHEGPVSLTGTGLKAVSEPSEGLTLAVPTADDLSGFTDKITAFATTAPKRGAVENSRLVLPIESVERGKPKDRLSPELAVQYDDLITRNSIIIEIEFISLERGPKQQRKDLSTMRENLQRELNRDVGGAGTIFEHEEAKGSLRAVVRCSGKLFEKLVQDDEWLQKIISFEARPEFETLSTIINGFSVTNLGTISPPPTDAPTVCIIDSGVTAGNPFLSPAVKEHLLKSFLKGAPNDPSDQFGHGSGVASLAAYDVLNIAPGGQNQAKVWIASARILTAENQLENEGMFSKLLKEVVEHFAPLGIKIFNLSVNDRRQSWNKDSKRTYAKSSWVARTIDQLSREHDVVFVVSTGNILSNDIRHFYRDGKEFPQYLCEGDACILDPGQAALALTVGSIAPSTQAEGSPHARAIALRDEASPFTRCGPGIRKDIKPEVVDYGGNLLIEEQGPIVRPNRGLSLFVASNQLTPAISFDAGTSLAAPRVAHKMALVLKDLQDLGIQPSASLLKAFVVNSSKSPTVDEEHKQLIGNAHWHNVAGHGVADDVRATLCDPYSVVLYYQGELLRNKICFLDIPVPAKLHETARTAAKRLTVTVVYAPEVQPKGLGQYLGTGLEWRMYRGNVSQEDIIASMSAPDEEAAPEDVVEENEDLNELKFDLGVTRRSRGTIQHAVSTWHVHKPEYSEHAYTLAITANEKWQRKNPPPVKFAVVVRLEEAGQSTEIYSLVQAAVNVEVQTRARS